MERRKCQQFHLASHSFLPRNVSSRVLPCYLLKRLHFSHPGAFLVGVGRSFSFNSIFMSILRGWRIRRGVWVLFEHCSSVKRKIFEKSGGSEAAGWSMEIWLSSFLRISYVNIKSLWNSNKEERMTSIPNRSVVSTKLNRFFIYFERLFTATFFPSRESEQEASRWGMRRIFQEREAHCNKVNQFIDVVLTFFRSKSLSLDGSCGWKMWILLLSLITRSASLIVISTIPPQCFHSSPHINIEFQTNRDDDDG